MRVSLKIAASCLVLAMAAPSTASAQWASAQRLYPLDQAYTAQQRGEFDRAQAIVRDARLRCGVALSTCQADYDFGAAVILQREAARHDGSKREELLGLAIQAYDELLKTYPKYWDAVYNKGIALRDAGEWRGAVQALSEASKINGAAAGEIRIEMGDVARGAGQIDEALGYYMQAYDLQRGAEAAARRAVDMLREFVARPAEPQRARYAATLRKLAAQFQTASPSVASDGFLALLRVEETAAGREKMFLRWLTATMEAESFETNTVVSLAPTIDLPAADLDALRQPMEADALKKSWWWGSALRRHTLAHLWFARGKRKSLGEAAEAWEFARRVVPDITEYATADLMDDNHLPLEIALELLQLYYAQPALDPNGRKFAAIENTLLGRGFVGHYREDLKLVQRFHTTLGLIYADRGLWQGSRTANSIDQLSRALLASEHRYTRDKVAYEPLPHVRLALANAYQVVGNRAMAGQMLLAAGRDYLDLDAYTDAISVVARAGEQYRSSIEGLLNIIKARQAVSSLRSLAFDSGKNTYLEREDFFTWLRVDPQGEPKEFLRRQRFKTFTDLAVRANLLNLRNAAQKYASDAWNHADTSRQVSSPEDAVRVEQLYQLETRLRIGALTAGNAAGVLPVRRQIFSADDQGGLGAPREWTMELGGQTMVLRFDPKEPLFDMPSEKPKIMIGNVELQRLQPGNFLVMSTPLQTIDAAAPAMDANWIGPAMNLQGLTESPSTSWGKYVEEEEEPAPSAEVATVPPPPPPE